MREDKIDNYTYLKRKFRITEGSFFRGRDFLSRSENLGVSEK